MFRDRIMTLHLRYVVLAATTMLGAGCGRVESSQEQNASSPASAAYVKDSDRQLQPAVNMDAQEPADPYRNAQSWCEHVELKTCKVDADCPDDRTGQAQRCVKPFWKQDKRQRVCAPRFPSKDEQARVRNRVGRVVSTVCRREQGCNPERLTKFMSLVAYRESSWRPWKVHNLRPDQVSARIAHRRLAKYYKNNPYFDQVERWRGYGLYGQNSAGFVLEWDRDAPPEILCRETESTLAYLRRARRVRRKLAGGIDCDGDGRREHRVTPTWENIHRGVSGGKLCPGKTELAATMARAFRVRARKIGLRPRQKVRKGMLGNPVPVEEQKVWAERMQASLDRDFPPPVDLRLAAANAPQG